MYARVTTALVQPGKMDELVRIMLDSVLPAARQQKGYHGGMVLANRENNQGEIIAVWETQADMEAGEASGYYREQVAKAAPILAAAPTREVYEVVNRE